MIKHNEKTQEMADCLAREEGDFCAVYYGKLSSERLATCSTVPPYNGTTLVYVARNTDSIDDDPYLKLILVQGENVFSIRNFECSRICKLTTGRNLFKRGKELYGNYEKQAIAGRISAGKKHQARKIVLAGMFHGRESRRAMKMVCEYLEIAERFDKKIEVRKYPYWDDADGGIDFYVHLI